MVILSAHGRDNTSLPAAVERDAAIGALNEYRPFFIEAYTEHMRAKLGLTMQLPEDARYVSRSLQLLQANAADYTRFFRRLCNFKTDHEASNDHLRDVFIDPLGFDDWAREYRARLVRRVTSRRKATSE